MQGLHATLFSHMFTTWPMDTFQQFLMAQTWCQARQEAQQHLTQTITTCKSWLPCHQSSKRQFQRSRLLHAHLINSCGCLEVRVGKGFSLSRPGWRVQSWVLCHEGSKSWQQPAGFLFIWFVNVAVERWGVAKFLLVCLKSPVEGNMLLFGGSFEILAGPGPAKLAGHDFHKAAIWLHEIVVHQAGTMHANLKQTAKAENDGQNTFRTQLALGRVTKSPQISGAWFSPRCHLASWNCGSPSRHHACQPEINSKGQDYPQKNKQKMSKTKRKRKLFPVCSLHATKVDQLCVCLDFMTSSKCWWLLVSATNVIISIEACTGAFCKLEACIH